jgi:hypothetical protein
MNVIAPPGFDCSFRLGVSLPFLGTNGIDVDAIVLEARAAVVDVANGSTSALTIASLTEAIEAVPGVAFVDRILLNGIASDLVDAPSYFTASQYVRVVEIRISP